MSTEYINLHITTFLPYRNGVECSNANIRFEIKYVLDLIAESLECAVQIMFNNDTYKI